MYDEFRQAAPAKGPSNSETVTVPIAVNIEVTERFFRDSSSVTSNNLAHKKPLCHPIFFPLLNLASWKPSYCQRNHLFWRMFQFTLEFFMIKDDCWLIPPTESSPWRFSLFTQPGICGHGDGRCWFIMMVSKVHLCSSLFLFWLYNRKCKCHRSCTHIIIFHRYMAANHVWHNLLMCWFCYVCWPSQAFPIAIWTCFTC